MKNNNVYAQQERELPCSSLSCAGFYKQKARRILRSGGFFWRKDGDSNPRTLLTRYTISSRAP